jgi:hypothetical protein
VFIAEDVDRQDPSFFTGRFSAHLQSAGDFIEGPTGVSAQEGVEWGRAHADVVRIRVGEADIYSAGRAQPAGAQLPEWPGRGHAPRPSQGREHGVPGPDARRPANRLGGRG